MMATGKSIWVTLVTVSRARSRSRPGVVAGVTGAPARSRSGPEVVACSRTLHISKVTDAISKFVHITHECMDYKNLIV